MIRAKRMYDAKGKLLAIFLYHAHDDGIVYDTPFDTLTELEAKQLAKELVKA